MWHPCRLTEISRGDALNYLKVSSPVIALTVVYPVGMGKSVSVEPRDGEANAAGCLLPLSGRDCGWLPWEALHHQREESNCPKSFFSYYYYCLKRLCALLMGAVDTLDKAAPGWCVCSSFMAATLSHQSLPAHTSDHDSATKANGFMETCKLLS